METFFYRKTIYSSKDPGWAARYLSSSADRITALLKEDLGNEFWEKYAQIYGEYTKSGRLLFRAKAIDGRDMTLVQVWRSQRDQMEFEAEAFNGVRFLSVLYKNGLSIRGVSRKIDESEVRAEIERIRDLPHLLQFVCDKWRSEEMVVGDPLKRGRGYLPFPDQKS